MKDPNVYFVENIISNIELENKSIERSLVVLLKSNQKPSFSDEASNLDFELIDTSSINTERIHFGQFISYQKGEFENANNTAIARSNFYFNNFYRGRLIKRQSESFEEYYIKDTSEIFSYHINVGHGNCSIIVINDPRAIRLWMVDCSCYDYLNHRYYTENIQACLQHITVKFSLNRIHIDKFFLTHTHFDHYSGIPYLINEGLITSKTAFLFNLHYSMPNENYTRLLRRILSLNPTIFEPISAYHANNIEIWHPRLRTIRSLTDNYRGQDVQIEPNTNNSSATFYLKFGMKSILFPGDLETPGWNSINSCPSYLQNCDYLIISHHGSINGHVRTNCPAGRDINNLSDCIERNKVPILMGRNNAYRGIYSQQVLHDFSGIAFSEKDPNGTSSRFLEIDWQTDQKDWR